MMEQIQQTLRPPEVEQPHAGRSVVTRIDRFPLRVPLSSIARQAMDESSTGLGMAIPARMDRNVTRNEVAKGVLDLACADLAAARFDVLGHAVEISGDVMFEATMAHDPIRAKDGTLPVPTGPGWGATVDRDALDDHTVGAPTSFTIDDLRTI